MYCYSYISTANIDVLQWNTAYLTFFICKLSRLRSATCSSLCRCLRLSIAHTSSCRLSALSINPHCFVAGLLLVTSADKEIVRNASFVVVTSIRA
ncbi:hypothetical protein Y032_0021g401 [Ancylostoma ceylanicum]|uniref:Uncharacterized protein n=1 Tax=Ancylostoma ceylanicum TaxID=53326 RepID=A0A016V0G5_9BILA|nr:hypothetical protein Y032_0021g401 [Ancylostoma ceylanicum]